MSNKINWDQVGVMVATAVAIAGIIAYFVAEGTATALNTEYRETHGEISTAILEEIKVIKQTQESDHKYTEWIYSGLRDKGIIPEMLEL